MRSQNIFSMIVTIFMCSLMIVIFFEEEPEPQSNDDDSEQEEFSPEEEFDILELPSSEPTEEEIPSEPMEEYVFHICFFAVFCLANQLPVWLQPEE